MTHPLPKVNHSQTVFQGKVVHVDRDQLMLDGREMLRDTVVHPDCVCGLAFTAPDEIVLVYQYRHPTRQYLWELPAGKIDPGETPEVAFRREMLEECGIRCDDVREITSFYTSPGVMTERMHLFAAHRCEENAAEWDRHEIGEWKKVSLDEARRMIDRGEICDAKSILGILMMAPRGTAERPCSGGLKS